MTVRDPEGVGDGAWRVKLGGWLDMAKDSPVRGSLRRPVLSDWLE